MNYVEAIQSVQEDPKRLEEHYRGAQACGDEAAFRQAIEACRQEAPENPLLAAWHYRLQPDERPQAVERSVDWKAALPIALVAGIICAIIALPAFDYADGMPYVALTWSLVGGAAIAIYLTIAGHKRSSILSIVLALLVAGAYATLVTLGGRRVFYRTLMMIHLPLLAVTAVAIRVLSGRRSLADRFAFLLKAIEVCVVGGVFVIVGGIFAGITLGLFQAIGVEFPVDLQRTLVAAGGGAITVLAVATVYDPHFGPAAQRVQQGLARIVQTMFRLLLPLALCVLVVYLFVIPFNFMVPFERRDVLIVYNVMLFAVVGLLLGATPPFERRDVLIVYNVMLFAVVGLLLGATPPNAEDLQARHHRLLRAAYLAVAALAVIISLYALSATAYRTALGGITLNRLTVIGWNLINIGLLVLLIVRALRRRSEVPHPRVKPSRGPPGTRRRRALIPTSICDSIPPYSAARLPPGRRMEGRMDRARSRRTNQ